MHSFEAIHHVFSQNILCCIYWNTHNFEILSYIFLPKERKSLENSLLILNQIHFLLFNNTTHEISILDEFT